MRAAVFIGGDGPSPGALPDGLGPFDVAIAADSGLSIAEEWGVVPDWIVGDMDSLPDPSRLAAYPASRIRRYPSDKDDTDTEIALALARELACDETVLIGGGGGRLDHLMAILALFERNDPPIRWFGRNEEIILVDAGTRCGTLERVARPGTLVSIFPVGAGPWHIESAGLKWPLAGLVWSRGRFGISNKTVAECFSVRAVSGRFLVLMPLVVSSNAGKGLG